MSSPSFAESWVQADRFAKEHPELTAEAIRAMPMSEWARLTGREPLRPTIAPVSTPTPGLAPQVEVTRDDSAEPEPVSVRDMTPEQYAAYRKQIGMGQSSKEGKGIFDSVSSRSEAYTNAARAQSGRTAMSNSNVEPAPRISRVTHSQVNESRLDARPLAERFGNASNAFRYE